MAKPIEPTPILTGEDAERLQESIDKPKYDSKKAEFLKDCEETYLALSSE